MENNTPSSRITRRHILGTTIATASLAILNACGGSSSSAANTPVSTTTAPGAGTTGQSAATAPQVSSGASQQFKGTTLRIMTDTVVYSDGLKANADAFTEQTGAKFDIEELSFAVLNQRADLELSSGSSAYDVIQMIFIRSGRFIGAGWAEPLNAYINDPSQTNPEQFDQNDFISGALVPFKKGDMLYALPWLVDSTYATYRKDILAKAGVTKFPETLDELSTVVKKIHTPETAGFITETNLGYIWPNWLFAYGGTYYKNPPADLTPTLDTPEAIKSAEIFTEIMSKYTVLGGINITPDIVRTNLQQGKAAICIMGSGNFLGVIDKGNSANAEQFSFAPVPAGPMGAFPQVAVHGYLIPKAAKNKKASWAWIKWATSKDNQKKIALSKFYLGLSRASVLNDPEVKQKYTWQGSDLSALHLNTVQRAGAGYMAYRTVPPYAPCNDRTTIAMSSIASGQANVPDGMKSLQRDVTDIINKSK